MGDVGTDGVDESKPGSSSPALALGVGAVALLVVFLAANRVFVNLEGPFGEHAVVGLLVSLAVAVAAGVLVTVATYAVARRSTWGLVALAGGLAAVAIVAFPTRIDRHESFVEQPNARSSCLGLTFTHYPPGTMDAASEIYCIGLERPAPAG
jgi:uncharacterized membrane protein (UPF0136 family)